MHTQFLNGVHDESKLDYDGWVVRVEQVGHNPTHTGGTDYSGSQYTVIARFQNGWGSEGCIPLPEYYEEFAVRVQNFVKASKGCDIWVIGNEMNHSGEWPSGRPIYPRDYGRCYSLCRARIRSLPGHENDQVIVGAVAPYNNQTQYPENPNGDWVKYFQDILAECGEVGGITLHCYGVEQTRSDPFSNAMMGGEFSHLHSGFRAYQDFLLAVPEELRDLPVYITETNPGARGEVWQDANTGWVQSAYAEIADWNGLGLGNVVRCLALYCWDHRGDGQQFQTKPGVQEDFFEAVSMGYKWTDAVEPTPPPVSPSPSPSMEPDECLFDAAMIDRIVRDALAEYMGQIRTVVREEIVILYADLRDAMREEVRALLNKSRIRVE